VRVLVTGATGFVGGALVPRLLAAGHQVRCLVRDPDRLQADWRSEVEVVGGAVEDDQAVFRAADGCQLAFFLVHGMAERLGGLVERERAAAVAFRDAVDLAGVRRIVYVGGLVDEDQLASVSEHLYARQQVGEELRAGSVPVTELRAGIVLGPGSASLALLVAAARSPLQLETPWAQARTQPIALGDLLDVVMAVIDDAEVARAVLEVGGPEVVTFAALVARTRAALGLGPRRALPLPYLPPEALATAAGVLGGVDTSLTLALLQSARSDTVVTDPWARDRYQELLATGIDAALATAVTAAVGSDGPR
jgi:uncharacterized protein YbjT (DUF2867 family)